MTRVQPKKFNALYKVSTHLSVKKQEKRKKAPPQAESLQPATVLFLELFKITPKIAIFA